MQVWTLTTDSGNGIDTSLHLTQEAAYKAAASALFSDEDDPEDAAYFNTLSALAPKEAQEWIDKFLMGCSTDYYQVMVHPHHLPDFEPSEPAPTLTTEQHYDREAMSVPTYFLRGSRGGGKTMAAQVASMLDRIVTGTDEEEGRTNYFNAQGVVTERL